MNTHLTLSNQRENFSKSSFFLSISILLLSLLFTNSVNAQKTNHYFKKVYNKKLNESYFFNARISQDADKTYRSISFTVGVQPGDAFSRGMTLGGFDTAYQVDGEIKNEEKTTIIPIKQSLLDSYIFEDDKPSRMAVRFQYLFKNLKEIKIGEKSVTVELEDGTYEIPLIQ